MEGGRQKAGAAMAGIALSSLVASYANAPRWVFLLLLLVGVGIFASPWPHARPALHQPPGDSLPMVAPVQYQVVAARQVVAKLTETVGEFDLLTFNGVLRNHPRRGTDPVYEPLHAASMSEGLAQLVRNGELEPLGTSRFRIVRVVGR